MKANEIKRQNNWLLTYLLVSLFKKVKGDISLLRNKLAELKI